MRRRSFLKSVTLGGVTAAIGPNLILGKGSNPSDRINAALIGARNMGGKTHLPTMVGEDRLQLRAICDVDKLVLKDALNVAHAGYAEKTNQASYKGIDGVGDYRELLTRDDIDAVVIATPDQWHVPMAKAFIKAGKSVYVEKPLSLFVTEGRELIELVDQHNAIVQVGTQRRSMDVMILACELLRNGVYGKIRHVDVNIGTRHGSADKWSPQPVPPELDYDMWVGPGQWTPYHPERVHYNFRFVSEYSGGDVTNYGAHYMDVALWGLGKAASGPVIISGTGKRNPKGSLHDTYFDVDVDFKFSSGVTLNFSGTDRPWKEYVIIFHCENGTLQVNNNSLESNPRELLRTSRDAFPIRFRKTPGNHLPNWVECVLKGKPEHLHAPVEVGHQSALGCHLVNIAMLTGRELKWDPDKERFQNDSGANGLLTLPQRKQWLKF
ncbi:MAG: Gfo/Idh/MocA family protein [Puniceicoccaceae bacterium]